MATANRTTAVVERTVLKCTTVASGTTRVVAMNANSFVKLVGHFAKSFSTVFFFVSQGSFTARLCVVNPNTSF